MYEAPRNSTLFSGGVRNAGGMLPIRYSAPRVALGVCFPYPLRAVGGSGVPELYGTTAGASDLSTGVLRTEFLHTLLRIRVAARNAVRSVTAHVEQLPTN